MTLGRQLMLSGLIILMFMFTGMISFVVRNTQTFLNEQLASHSQDTATALGLTLTTIVSDNDLVTANRIIDAIWDRGYYRSIRLENPKGELLTERTTNIKVYGVPSWFIRILDLKTAPKEALIMSGWQKIGKIYVESNPGFAYTQIWLTFMDSVQWFLASAAIAMVLGGILLFIILKPLRAITAQAVAICNQQFPIQEELPWTIDLRLVVDAMNTMSGRLKRLFEEQTRASEQLREQAFKDPVTKLGNRRYFDMQFDYLLQDHEKKQSGGLLLIELINFKEYNDKYGYQEGDALLQNVANALQTVSLPVESAIVAHAKGASLILVLPNKTKEYVQTIAQDFSQKLNEFANVGLSKEQDVANIGVVLFSSSDNKKDILAKADIALRKAQNTGANHWELIDEIEPQAVQGATQWAALFERVIKEKQVVLYFQETRVLATQQDKIYEVFMRLKAADGTLISAGTFMPMAERLNQINALDALVAQQVIAKIASTKGKQIFCVNISPSLLDDNKFKNQLLASIKSLGKKANQLILELPEYGVVKRIDAIREFFLKVSALGAQTSIDHYGKSFSSFSYLYNIKLNYLKIDGGFTKNIHENKENQFFVRSLVDIARSLGICVIAEAVETQQEYEALSSLKIDGVQGYFVSKPSSDII